MKGVGLNSFKRVSISIEVVSDKCLKISSLSAILASGKGGTKELRSDCDNSPKPIAAVDCCPTGTEAS